MNQNIRPSQNIRSVNLEIKPSYLKLFWCQIWMSLSSKRDLFMLIETRTVYMIHMVKRNSNTHDDHRSMTFFSVFGCWKLQNLTNNPRNRNVKE